MLREVQDKDGTTWSLAQAYAGLATSNEEKEEKSEAAGAAENGISKVQVVATPSGGAQTVRLELASDWENRLSDEDLLREIENQKS